MIDTSSGSLTASSQAKVSKRSAPASGKTTPEGVAVNTGQEQHAFRQRLLLWGEGRAVARLGICKLAEPARLRGPDWPTPRRKPLRTQVITPTSYGPRRYHCDRVRGPNMTPAGAVHALAYKLYYGYDQSATAAS